MPASNDVTRHERQQRHDNILTTTTKEKPMSLSSKDEENVDPKLAECYFQLSQSPDKTIEGPNNRHVDLKFARSCAELANVGRRATCN
jgi:hypothetical protein